MLEIFDHALEGYEVTNLLGEDASSEEIEEYFEEYVSHMCFGEIEYSMRTKPAHSREIGEWRGVQVWYCYGADHYWFSKADDITMVFEMTFSSSDALMMEDPKGETIALLKKMIQKVENQGFDQGRLKDTNGVSIGSYHFDLRKAGE